MNGNSPPLVKDRATLQQLRGSLDHRESVTTAVRMLRSVLGERADRLARNAEPIRTDEDISAYLDDLLNFHAGSGPGLSYLSQGLSNFIGEFGTDDRYTRLDPGPNQAPFPAALEAYVSGSGSRQDAHDAFESVVESDAPERVGAMAWFFDEHLHPIAHESVEDTESSLRARRDQHVDNLQTADQPTNSTEPLETLGWDDPVAMLPVRLETKFVDATPRGGDLKVRVYADQIHVDTHEPELTEAEYEWGTEFWAQVWFITHDMQAGVEQRAVAVHDGTPPGDDAPADRLPNDRLRRVVADLYDQISDGAFSEAHQERFEEVRDRAWSRGVDQFGTERAAYIVHALSPEDGGTQIGDELLEGPQAGHWIQPVDEFEELSESDQMRSFLYLDDSDKRWVLRQLQGPDALDDVEDRLDLFSQMAEGLLATTQRRRLELLVGLLLQGRLDRDELDWIRSLLDSASPIQRPPPLRFPEDDVTFRPASWTRPPRARLLPDRWVIYAYWTDVRGTPDLSNSPWSTDWQSAGTNAWRRWDPDREQWVKKVTGPAIREPLPVGPRPESVAGKDRSGEAGMEWMLDFAEAKQAGMGLEFDNPDDGSWDGAPGGDDAGYDQLVVTGLRTSGDPDRSADQLQELLAAQEYTQGLSFLQQGTPTNNADESSGRSSSDDAAASAPVKVGDSLVPLDGVDRETVVPLAGDEVTADAARLADALGVDSERFAHVENADTIRNADAGHVNEALWPATWGYYAKHLLVPEFWKTVLGGKSRYGAQTEAVGWLGAQENVGRLLVGWLAKFRNHFRSHVRGGGPFQTLQIGPQPYGILPTTPLAVDDAATPADVDQFVDPVREGPDVGLDIATTADGPTLRYLDPETIPEEALLSTLVRWVSTLRSTWLRSADDVPRIGDGNVTDQQLLDLLSMEASPRTLRRQSWLLDDESAVWQLFDSDGRYRPATGGSRRRPTANGGTEALREQNLSQVPALSSPRIASMRFFGQAGLLSDADDLVDASLPGFLRTLRGTLDNGLYASLPSQTGSEPPDPERWLDRLRSLGGYWRVGWRTGIQFESPDWFSSDTPVETPQRGPLGPWDDLVQTEDLTSAHSWLSAPEDLSTSSSVLRTVLHFATLREVASTRVRLGTLYEDPLEMAPDPATYLGNETIYQELLSDLGQGETPAIAAHPAVSSGTSATPTYADAVRAAATDGVSPPLDQYLERFGRSLDHLSGMEPGDVEARAMETFGLASHRLDAWWTSIATRRLQNMREGRQNTSQSDGTLVGAFGFVEDLAPDPDETGEYLLAPSQNQVTTAAVLRSAHRAADEPAHADTLAVDLSAERVRRARSLLDGVRNGRSVSAILGHRFERRLRQATEDDDQPNLRQYRGDFRAAAPSKGGPAGHRKQSANESVTHSKRSDVVDGRALLRAYRSGSLWTLGNLGTLASDPQVQNDIEAAVESILADFDRWLDAVNDVLTAEAVHQLSKGNPDRATAALEGISRGKQLPELEVLRTPRRETGINNRLMVLFGDAEWRDTTTSDQFDSRYALRKWEMDRADIINPGDLPDLGEDPDQFSPSGTQSKQSIGMRHVGEPNLNGWVGELLPQPDRVRCETEFRWTSERQFATGTFDTPTEPGVVTVTDVGFEPDVLVFRVSNAPSGKLGQPTEGVPVHGWTHGVVHDAPDGLEQRSMSLVAPDQGAPEYATTDRYALVSMDPDDGSTTAAIRASVDATIDDGFQVVFDAVADQSLIVQYQAIQTGDSSAVRVGQFTTDAVSSAPETQAIDLDTGKTITGSGGGGGVSGGSDFDPDHLLLTACTGIKKQNRSAASSGTNSPIDSGRIGSNYHTGSLVGFCHGEAARTGDGLDQQAITSAVDMAGDDGHAVGFQDDAALELLYGTGDGVTDAATAHVTKLGQDSSGRPRLELEYQPQSDGVDLAKDPAVVTYVAYESPRTEDPVKKIHRPAVGYVAAPASEGGSVTVEPGFDPACVEVTVVPGVTASPGAASEDQDSQLTVRRTTTGTAGWTHGVATDLTDQRVLHEAVRPLLDESLSPSQYVDETVGVGSATNLLSIAYLDDKGAVAGRDVGRLARMDDDGITIEFPELHSAADSDRPVVLYRAWPTDPEELPHATDRSSAALASLDISPLDAVSLSQVDAEPGLSQLERRLQYYLFRHRPTHRPPVPDDADLEITFADTGTDDDTHVSFAEYLEAARSARDLLSDGRPVDAEDLAHPSKADGPGYLPPGSPDESNSAAELRKRADEVQRRLDAARAIIENRHNLLDVPDDERNICDRVDAIDRAVETFCREVPARQVHTVAGQLNTAHDPTDGPTVIDELRELLEHIQAGPTDVATLADDVVVETGGTRTVELVTDAPGDVQLDIEARSHSPGEHFGSQQWTRETDTEGRVEIDFDAIGGTSGSSTGITPGTRFTVVARRVNPPPSLDTVLERELRALDREDREELYRDLRQAEILDDEEVERIEEIIEETGSYLELIEDGQVAVFLALDRDTKLDVLDELGRSDLAERYDEMVTSGLPLVTTGRVVKSVGGQAKTDSLGGTLQSQALVPRLLWLETLVDEIRPVDGSVGETLADALAPSTIDWNQVETEKQLMSTIKPLTSPDAFGSEDFAAVQRLTELQAVDLSTSTGLAGKLDAALAPLERVGLTDLVTLTGAQARPDDQRYWKREECQVGDVWDRPCEGSVRARLRNLLRAPGWPGAPEEFSRFAPEFRKVLVSGNLQPEYLFVVETILKNPAPFVRAMDGDISEPATLLQDLNEMLYHPTELTSRITKGTLRSRLESFRDWLDTGDLPDDVEIDTDAATELWKYLRTKGIGELVQWFGQVNGMAPTQRQSSLEDTYEHGVGNDLATLRGSSSAHGSTQHAIADRIAVAFEKADLGPPFRRGVLETLRRGLLRASYAGIYGSTPNSTAGGTQADQATLLDQAEVVVEALGERVDRARTLATAAAADTVSTQVDRLEALLGENFVVLPPFAPSNPAELATTFGDSDDLVDNDPYAVDTWLQRIARVRDRPAGFREVLTYADLFDLAGGDDTAATGGTREATIRRSLTVGQLPHSAGTGGESGQSWIGLDGVTPSGGELSMAALFVSESSVSGTRIGQSSTPPVSPTAGNPPMAGLFIDGWVTKVPEEEQELGVGFRYDDPDVRPPQSIVLAVPPSWSRATEEDGLQPTAPQTWSMATLRTTLEETTDLVRARSVDLDALDSLGHVLPAACFPYNEDSDLVPYQPEVFLPDAPSVLLDTFDWDTLE